MTYNMFNNKLFAVILFGQNARSFSVSPRIVVMISDTIDDRHLDYLDLSSKNAHCRRNLKFMLLNKRTQLYKYFVNCQVGIGEKEVPAFL